MSGSTEQNPTNVFPQTGTYTVTFQITMPSGKEKEVSQDIDVFLTTDISFDYVADCLTIQFIDTSEAPFISEWTWDFGDGIGTSTEQYPIYTYLEGGDYTVTLTIQTLHGGVGTAQILVTVDDCAPDTWCYEFDFTDNNGGWTGLSGSYDSGNGWRSVNGSDGIQLALPETGTITKVTVFFDIVSGSWNVSRTSYVCDSNPCGSGTFTYGNAAGTLGAGSYSLVHNVDTGAVPVAALVQLVVSAAGAGNNIIIRSVTYEGTGDNPFGTSNCGAGSLVAEFHAVNVFGDDPLEITFFDDTVHVGNIVSWEWDFGDSSGTSTDQNPVYTYGSGGTYTVILDVEDEFGNIDTVSHEIDTSLLEAWEYTLDPAYLISIAEGDWVDGDWIGDQGAAVPYGSILSIKLNTSVTDTVITYISLNYTLTGTRNVPVLKDYTLFLDSGVVDSPLNDFNYSLPGTYTKTWSSIGNILCDQIHIQLQYGSVAWGGGADSDATLTLNHVVIRGSHGYPF